MEITAPCISGTVFIIGGADAVAIWQPIYISCTSFFSFWPETITVYVCIEKKKEM